jgi:putative tricarboxylic transport membrane protein
LGLTALALVLYPGLLTVAGFLIATSVLFWLVAMAFDNRRRLRDAVIAIVFSASMHFVFARGLGLSLPAGWLGAWIR